MVKSELAQKITATLILISVLLVIVVTSFMLLITRQQFADYIHRYDQAILNQWLPIINEYYEQNGPEGLQEYLESNTAGNSINVGMGKRRGQPALAMRIKQVQRLIVTDMQGMVVADSRGLLIGKTPDFDLSDASSGAILTDGLQVGTLYVISPLGSGLASLENDYISKLTASAVLLALFAALSALLLGLILGKRVSAPLGELSTAIHQVAKGKLDKRIDLQGDQEFIQLGHDFNLMAQSLEEADERRRRLTADLSHELRTPLTFLRGQLEGMQAGNIPADNENVTLLLDEVIRLTRLVKELDNLALVENHAVSLNMTTFPVTELLDRLTPVNIAMQDKGIEFTIEVGNDIQKITADLDRLLQILLNLLTNAMQHVTSAGFVTLSIQRRKDHLQFAVADNGSGIPAGDLPHVFERFYRIDDSRSRREGGMGLGLAIAKGYAEAHNGKMWVESSVGSGTTFYFTLGCK
ncbi:MAG TPA: ATP-binding protein [Syntrophomonadaceae bacterium]|nr:ATP-binding protein [Syntrophomonadaceae bacterium]HPR94384.1 ATP-binding protein [Syntrophomonadaceae bacterium]